MPNPLLVIAPALELLGKNVNILPATGKAVEDLQHPDQDEIDDVLIHHEMGKGITAFAEVPEPPTNNSQGYQITSLWLATTFKPSPLIGKVSKAPCLRQNM